MARWQFNRGEWTKAYVFMRLLGEGRIYGASSDLVLTKANAYIEGRALSEDEVNACIYKIRMVNLEQKSREKVILAMFTKIMGIILLI